MIPPFKCPVNTFRVLYVYKNLLKILHISPFLSFSGSAIIEVYTGILFAPP
jgi:hypothetical protein